MDIYDNDYKGRFSPTFTTPMVTKPERECCAWCGNFTRVDMTGLCTECAETKQEVDLEYAKEGSQDPMHDNDLWL